MFLSYLWKTFRLILIAGVAILLTRTFLIEPGRVNGISMEPTFLDDELFFMNKLHLILSLPKRGQIVQSRKPNSDKLLLKRIVGLPGETIEIRESEVLVTGADGVTVRLQEPYLGPDVATLMPDMKPHTFPTLGPNEYFVLGDNRRFSGDSREYGAIPRDAIIGLVMTSR